MICFISLLLDRSLRSLTDRSLHSLTDRSLCSLTDRSFHSLTDRSFHSLIDRSLCSLTDRSFHSLIDRSLCSLTDRSLCSLTDRSFHSLIDSVRLSAAAGCGLSSVSAAVCQQPLGCGLYTPFGFPMRAVNRILPCCFSRMTRKNGRFTMNSLGSVGILVITAPPVVTAAASVPVSSTAR